jgi:pilus assembly protein FimV
VKYKDTLFDIANQMRPDGITVNQMMLALARNNPQAFYNGNINQLKAGFVLRIEDANQLTALSESEANAEVDRQRIEWEARKSGKLVRQTGEAAPGGRVARGEAAGGGMSAAEQARLKLVAPGSEGAGSGAGSEEVAFIGRYADDFAQTRHLIAF